MKSLILAAFVLCAFGSEVLIDSKESFRNNAYNSGGSEFSENYQNSQKLENSENSKNLKNSKNSSGEILLKKYRKWEDLENEWEEKWQRDKNSPF